MHIIGNFDRKKNFHLDQEEITSMRQLRGWGLTINEISFIHGRSGQTVFEACKDIEGTTKTTDNTRSTTDMLSKDSFKIPTKDKLELRQDQE
jgi:hypothetical protein